MFICSQAFTTTCKHVKVAKNVHSFSEQTLNKNNFVHTDQNNDPFFFPWKIIQKSKKLTIKISHRNI